MISGGKTSKKRAALSQIGPKSKKIRSEKLPTRDGKPSAVQRGRPVTLPQARHSDASSDEEVESSSEGTGLSGEDEEMLDVPTKDPNATREAHKAQKILLDQRKASKPHAALIRDAKRVWDLARQKNIGSDRKKHIGNLMNVVRGHVKDIVFKHDASRIIQTIVRWGGPAERSEIATELKGSYKDLSESKYSKFLVTKLIRFCPSQRTSILAELRGHVLRLLLHREASSVIADAFELHANAYDRSLLVRDLYGKEAALFSSITVGSEADKDKAKKGLEGVLEGASPDQRTRILNATKENIMTILNNPEKGAVTHAVVHRALWEYLSVLSKIENEVEREKLWREIFEACQDVLAEMVHTRDGSRLVREFIVRGTAKDRKQIVKAIKPYVERISQEELAQSVLFSAFDVIDDTKLVAKSLVSELTAAAPTIWKSTHGRRSLLYLIAPRSRRHFTPAQIAALAETDAVKAQTSKKDDSLRAAEIRKAASESLLEFVAKHGKEVTMDTGGSLLVTEIMLQADGDQSAATETLLELIASPYPAPTASSSHPIDASHTARLYKTLLQGGHYDQSSKSIAKPSSSSFSPSTFASSFLTTVGRDVTVAMAQGNGAFVVAELCRRVVTEGTDGERRLLLTWLTQEGVDKDIRDKEMKGKSILLGSIDALSST